MRVSKIQPLIDEFVRREPGRDGKILSDSGSDHKQDGNEVHRLYYK